MICEGTFLTCTVLKIVVIQLSIRQKFVSILVGYKESGTTLVKYTELYSRYLDEVETLDEVDTDDDVDTELELGTLKSNG